MDQATIAIDQLVEFYATMFADDIRRGRFSIYELDRFRERLNPFEPPIFLCVDHAEPVTYPSWVAERLHKEFDRCDTVTYDLGLMRFWLHRDQTYGGVMNGRILYESIKQKNILSSCISLRDLLAIQRLGIRPFRRYVGGRSLYAWKDAVLDKGGVVRAPYAIGAGDRVVVGWSHTDGLWGGSNPAGYFGDQLS